MYAMVCGLTFLRAQAQMLPKNEAVIKSNKIINNNSKNFKLYEKDYAYGHNDGGNTYSQCTV